MKCILLVRVSSDKQSFDEQEKELYQMAIADGFTDNNIISIAMVESATMKSEEERKGLVQMKEIIESDRISCVYAWEVSRISRRKDVLYSILRFLELRKINLKIKSPSITYLNPDGTVNDGAEVSFALFATMAESEMRNKKARFKRSAKKNAREGKYSGGNVLYGYDVDDNGYYIINEGEASIIRLIFDLYISNNYGTKILRNEMVERGYNITIEKIYEILANEAYVGKHYITRKRNNGFGDVGGYERIYPRIISEETYRTAKVKRESKHVVKTESCMLAKGLIKCPCCGWSYVGIRGKAARMYKCGQYNLADKHGRNCENKLTVQMEVTDSILWYASSFLYSLFLIDVRNSDTAKIEGQMNVLNQKINTAKSFIEGASVKMERIGDLWMDGIYTDEKKDRTIKKIKSECADKKKEIERWENEIDNMRRIIQKIQSLDEYTLFSDSTLSISKIDDRKKMLEIVNQFVDSVEVGETEYKGKSAKTFQLNFKDGTTQKFLTIGRTKNTRFFEYMSDEWFEITDKVLILQPF
ncbi:MAG: recombinase family protein [Duncaniella sp.]|uniref:recombinase family protein n=1 Tax=Duncaniella sp. TaxID=2518496 RepID=UPI0023D70064|nr:recombinase family protein [Duncaniella sp.]MDE6089845.1 recombinase family protein [Duncaniella sp.]